MKKRQKKYYFLKKYIDEGESIMWVAHKHVLVLKFEAAKSVFFGIMLPIALYVLFPKMLVLWTLWTMGAFLHLFTIIDCYDAWILMNQVVDIERDGLFNVTLLELIIT